MPWMETHFPLRDLGLHREHVFAILEETVGVPDFYRYKSRSGCGICPYMRAGEMLATLEVAPETYARAEQVEKLSATDVSRYEVHGEDVSARRMAYPIPQFIDIRTASTFEPEASPTPSKQNSKNVMDLFDDQRVDLYVGIEYLADPMMSWYGGCETGTPGVWHSQLVSWSTTRGGLSRKLTTHYHTRLDTCEVFGLKQKAFREQYGMAVFHVELPANQVDLGDTSEGTYSWRRNEPLIKLRQIASAVKHLMEIENDRDTLKAFAPYKETNSWEAEQYEYSASRLKQLDSEQAGQLLGTYRFLAGERPQAPSSEKAPCFVCSK